MCREGISNVAYMYAVLTVTLKQIGGVGHIVEIDETSLKKKSKYNRGKRHKDFWLFGGVDRTTNRWFGRLVYDKRTKETLLPIIKQYIKPGCVCIIYLIMYLLLIRFF